MAYMGRLHPKGEPFQASGIWKGGNLIMKGLGKSDISVCKKLQKISGLWFLQVLKSWKWIYSS